MKGRKVVVGVTGGIAAYKAAELVRLLVKEGAVTKVAMTRHATKFITPLTLETLSGNRVIADMWSPETHPLDHITWGQDSELIIIAPATANFIGKMAHGIGDDFLYVDFGDTAQAVAVRTGAVRGIEGKGVRLRFIVGNA